LKWIGVWWWGGEGWDGIAREMGMDGYLHWVRRFE
jgi:hypothetical protein